MSLPAYPAYRDSGVPWLGRVPAHWRGVRVKDCFQIVNGATPRSDTPEYWDGDIVWVTPADLSNIQGWDITKSQRTISPNGLFSCAATIVQPGSIVISTRAPIGSIGIAAVPLCTNQGCRALVPCAGTETRFFAYALTAFTLELNLYGRGTTFSELSADALGAFPICMPPPAEQRAIAAFLDRECGKIDALVAEQERLIALLKEKRQAVISHAVTKGLDPSAPMKDSGVAWLGQVPAHWNLTRLRFIARFNPSKSEIASLLPETEVSFLPMDAIGDDGSLRLDATRPLSAVEQGYTYFRDGDLLIAKITPCFENGKGALAAGLLGGIGFGTTELIVVRPLPGRAVAAYLQWLFVGPDFRNAGTAAMYGAGGQKRVPDEFVRNFVVAVPPPAEQRAIAAFLDRECGKIDTLISESERAIALLKERRAALISAAVTGQIDVRGLVPTEEAKAA
jgi:type I restriction enzyme S subunit